MSDAIQPQDLERFRALVAQRLGLHLDDSKTDQLAETLGKRTKALRETPSHYLLRLQSQDAARDEIGALARELTISETYFFRNIDQFKAFSEVAVPDRARARAQERRLQVLSAGCASGEEAYSLAMLLHDMPAIAGWDVTIRGVDVNSAVLERAAAGHYTSWALRETPADMQARRFRGEGRDFVLDAAIRAMVRFEERNLTTDDAAFWRPETFDVVFCRNVIMYFTLQSAQAVVANISRSLALGGYLFLGHAETLRGLSHDFHLRHTHGTFYYQRRETPSDTCEIPWTTTVEARAPPSPVGTISDDSWVATIRRASELIESLMGSNAVTPARGLPALPDLDDGARCLPDLRLAIYLLGHERFSEAHEVLTGLPPDSARDPDVLLLKAVLLTHGGDLATVEKLCLEILALDEMSAGAHYLMALCREDAGDAQGAAEHDRVASYLDPDFAMPRLHLGLLARRAADPAAGRPQLEEALSLLQREETSRLLLFSGGFGREALIALCRAEIAACGGVP